RVQDSLLSSASRFTDYRGILNWIIILLVSLSLSSHGLWWHGFLIDLWKVLKHLMEDDWPSLYLIMGGALCLLAVKSLFLMQCR
ncbi:hypothetical protein JZ751_027069, partial [Albula glossodonta]